MRRGAKAMRAVAKRFVAVIAFALSRRHLYVLCAFRWTDSLRRESLRACIVSGVDGGDKLAL